MVEQVAQDAAGRVAARRRGPVGAEHRQGRLAARRGHEHDDDDGCGEHAVEDREAPQRAPQPLPLDRREEQRGGRGGSDERHRLRAGLERDPAEHEQRQLPRRRRPLQGEHEEQCDDEEQGVERVLRHQRARVEHRRDEHREDRHHEREPRPQHPPCDQVGRHRRERHQDGVDRLRRRVDAAGSIRTAATRARSAPGRRGRSRAPERRGRGTGHAPRTTWRARSRRSRRS